MAMGMLDPDDLTDLPQRVRVVMREQGIPLNSKTLAIEGSSSVLTELIPVLTDLGKVESTEMLENLLKVTYSKVTEAFLAKETFNGITIGAEQLKVTWEPQPSKLNASLFTPTPDVFVPISISSSSKIQLPPRTPLKYYATFYVKVPNESSFNSKARVLGARGCNFYKIADTVAEKLTFDQDRAADVIKLRLVELPEFTIKITSCYLDCLQLACSLTSELLSALYEEYKRFCELAELTPPDLTVMHLQRVKGRQQALREGLGNLGNCMAYTAA
jgi:hypothetical protein